MVKDALLWVMGGLYVLAGMMHFVAPAFFMQIMPPWVPFHAAMVALSGVAEIALGILVLIPSTQRFAAWGLIALLIAVFPANIHMAVNQVQLDYRPEWMSQPTPLQAWLRLPLQFVLIAWAWWYTREPNTLISSHARPNRPRIP